MRTWLAAISILLSPAVFADAIDTLTPGNWVELPNTRMRSVCPANTTTYDWSFYCQSVVTAWNGATLDTSRGRLILFGGGHDDYRGNEVYTFDLATLQWSRVWGPSPDSAISTAPMAYETYSDGNPSSRHTYSGLTYVPPPIDSLFTMGGSLYRSGSYSIGTWRFNFGTNAWQRRIDGPAEQGFGDPSVYDPMTGHIFRRANSRMQEYDPVANTYTPRANSNGGFWLDNVSAALDPTARLMVMMGNGRVDLYRLDTDQYQQAIAIVGGYPPGTGAAPGLTFDSMLRRFVVWRGGSAVYTFDPQTRSFSTHTPGGATPSMVTASGGTFGRFQYVPSRNVFVAVNSANENVFVLRMSPGQGTPLPDAGVVDAGSAGGQAGGGSAGGSTSGGSTAGGSTSGGSTSGGSTAGGSTSGGSTAGGSTSGGSTAGGSTSGGSTAGGSAGATAGGMVAGGTSGGSSQTPSGPCGCQGASGLLGALGAFLLRRRR